MNIHIYRFIITGFLIVTVFTSCLEKNRFYLSEMDQRTEVKIKRFDLDFIKLDLNNTEDGLMDLYAKYPDFFPLFFNNGLGLEPDEFGKNASLVRDFITNTQFSEVHREVESVFNNTKSIEEELSTAYSYLNHYFPHIKLPEIYFFVSGFNHQFLITDSLIGIGSDVYLGKDFLPYRELTYDYLIPNMRPEMLVPELLSELLHHHFPFNGELNLLNAMIHQGKIMYLLWVLMPGSTDERLMGYDKEQISWCRKNSSQIWTKMLENKDLFSTQNLLIAQYMQLAPFTTPVSQESPGRLGVWKGWQIVKSYMQNNKNIDLKQLMEDTQYQRILQMSGYKP